MINRFVDIRIINVLPFGLVKHSSTLNVRDDNSALYNYFRSGLLALTGAICRAERQAGPGGSDVISCAAGGRFRSAHGLPSPAAPRSRDRVLGARQEPEFPQRAARPPRTLHDAGARSDVAMLGVARFLQSQSQGLRKVAKRRPISISDV